MIFDLGLIDYEEAYKIQKQLVRRRKLGEIGNSVIIAEHPPVFTIGKSGKRENLLVSGEILEKEGIKVLSVDRGGDITFHGPGQLVIYPIMDLRDRGKDLHKYLRDMEGLAINFLHDYSVSGRRVIDRTGAWTDKGKIAFIGIAASDWITYHGLSININCGLKFFSMIRPCGLKDVEVTSLNVILNRDINMPEAKGRLLQHFKILFSLEEGCFATNCAVLA